jgi:hypothetical protein
MATLGIQGSIGVNASQLYLTASGNIGIGTTTPLNILSIRTNGSTAAASPSILFSASSTAAMWISNWTIGSDLADLGKFKISSSTVLGANDRFVINGNGNIGIGTTSPWGKLAINQFNGGLSPLFTIASSTGSLATSTLFIIDKQGYVGIGTTTPPAKLTIASLLAAATTGNMLAISTSTTGWIFRVDTYGKIWADGGASVAPADYAEYFYTNNSDLQSGEVVCVDIVENNAVKRCERGADNNVMGIISTKPAIVGNDNSQVAQDPSHYAIVGMLGQVDAFVSAENGPINIGDSLTSASSTPGYAMRADGGDSTVGVALEPLASGTGKIKVLISRRNKSLAVEEVEALVVERIANMKIEDQVQQMIKQAVNNLNLDPKIAAIAQEEAGKLDAALTVRLDDVNGVIADLRTQTLASISDLNNQMLSLRSALAISADGGVGIGTTMPAANSGVRLAVGGDIVATGFVNVSTREAEKYIEYLNSADYENVLAKISEVKVATYYYNNDQTSLVSKRLGLIAEEAPLEVLSVDGKGVDLYKLTSFTLAGVKMLNEKVNDQQLAINSLENRLTKIEGAAAAKILQGEQNFNQSLETLGGDKIQLAPSSIAALVDNLYASVISGLKSMSLVVEQGIVHAQKLVTSILQTDKLTINTTPADVNGQHKDATIGSAQINVGELNTYIINNQVSTTTMIFVTVKGKQAVPITVCEENSQNINNPDGTVRGQGFRICLNEPAKEIVKFNWWIVETAADSATSDASNIASPSPSPSLEPSVSPEVSPSPSISPESSASPSPSVEPSVSPSSSPEPTASPSPSVEPSTSPEPSPSTNSGQAPTASPEPSVSPSSEPSSLSPEPSPLVSPEPIPSSLS